MESLSLACLRITRKNLPSESVMNPSSFSGVIDAYETGEPVSSSSTRPVIFCCAIPASDINKNAITKIYRELSNVIHGKSDNFESSNPDRFKHKKADLLHVLNYVLIIENILLSLWKKRFPIHFEKMEIELLAITKYTYEY